MNLVESLQLGLGERHDCRCAGWLELTKYICCVWVESINQFQMFAKREYWGVTDNSTYDETELNNSIKTLARRIRLLTHRQNKTITREKKETNKTKRNNTLALSNNKNRVNKQHTNTLSFRHARTQFYVGFLEYALKHVQLLLVGILSATKSVNGQSAPKRNRSERQPGRLGRCEPLERCDWYDGWSGSRTRDIGTTASATNTMLKRTRTRTHAHAHARTYVQCIYSSALKTLRSQHAHARACVRACSSSIQATTVTPSCARKCHHAPLCTAPVGYGRTHTHIYRHVICLGWRERDLLIKKIMRAQGIRQRYWYERDRLGMERFSYMYVMDKCEEWKIIPTPFRNVLIWREHCTKNVFVIFYNFVGNEREYYVHMWWVLKSNKADDLN